ncbi:MAG: galactokinase [Bacteroidales bacterium]|nr:galactokinase [Bacteroidales bacterium]
MNSSEIKNKFIELFESEPIIVKAPGRINLIGEHTDYNDGFVLPAAINKNIYFAVQKNNLNQIRLFAENLNDSLNISIDKIEKNSKEWANYLLGSYLEIVKAGFDVQGFDCVFGGDIPLGAGLSSSAAIECGLIFGLNELYQLNISNLQIAKLAQKAENNFVGVKCGIMDQFAIVHGEESKVIRLDCRTLEYTSHSFDLKNYIPILINTNVKHSLASSEYNTRRKECEAGVEIIQKYVPNVSSLRDITLNDIEKLKKYFDPIIYKRCTFVIEENQRVNQFCEDLNKNDLLRIGELIYESHKGLRDKYEVSCKELDILVDEAMNMDCILGSRMMGGGFGGCTLNLVKRDSVDIFKENISKIYTNKTNIKPDFYTVEITKGLEIIN